MTERAKIVVVGSINIDLVVRAAKLPRPGETLIGHDSREVPGGKGANQAVAAAQLGAHAMMIGCVGDDAFGARLNTALELAAVDTSCVQAVAQCGSGLAVVMVDDQGQNSIVVVPGANAQMTPARLSQYAALIREARVLLVQLEIPHATVAAALREAREAGVITVLDPAPAPDAFPTEMMPVDIMCPNESEAERLTGIAIQSIADAERAADWLYKNGVRIPIITLGAQGALVRHPELGPTHIPALKLQAVDTTAAGDAFAGALGVALSTHMDLIQAVQYACAAGSIAASRPGAQPSMPTPTDIAQMTNDQ